MSAKFDEIKSIIEKYDSEINDLYKSYLGPDIPEKVINKLIKNYDSHLPINSIVAFYDETVFNSCKSGVILTTDGIYHKFLEKPVFIKYNQIREILGSSTNMIFKIDNEDFPEYSMITSLKRGPFERCINEIISAVTKYGDNNAIESGKITKKALPEKFKNKCHAIIHTASTGAGAAGAGLAQAIACDNAIIVPIQITMIISLGKVFNLNITEAGAKGIISSAAASIAGRTVSQVLFGWIPGLGNAINTATAAGITEAIGWLAVNNFYARYLEDLNKGRLEGMKDGYVEASNEYEAKLRAQAQEFINQKKDFEKERDEYEQLLNDYEQYIKELSQTDSSSNSLNELKIEYFDLLNSKN